MAGQGVITVFGLFVLRQDEVGVRLTLGRFSGVVQPGLGFNVPIIHKVIKTKSSLQTIDLPEQQIVLSGNISVIISGNLNFRVKAPDRALLAVDNYRYSIQQLALTTIADVLGSKTIEEVRGAKLKIAEEIEAIVSRTASNWGLADVDIRLTDARMDEGLQRAMMRETEARKEANAIKIKAESDKYVAGIFAEAADSLAKSPGAMTLRVLQTLSDVSNDKTTIVVPVPIDLLTRQSPSPVDISSATSATSESPELLVNVPDVPMGKIKIRGDKAVAVCPACNARYDVTAILGESKVDAAPEIPGQQIQCKRCGQIFTLPEVD
ncbi:MAG: hypothetical protein CL946_08295 [Ectothiorhodospiraceae bacterium]|nr:hypothetical protein [Ectothiorhodospiraceae bacterium]